jgi:hypothetical protein
MHPQRLARSARRIYAETFLDVLPVARLAPPAPPQAQQDQRQREA